ncbi:MAG: hypothetical protein ACTTJ3_02560 [Treponema sp.]
MKSRMYFFVLLGIIFFSLKNVAYSQSAKAIERILSSSTLSVGDACYLAGVMVGNISDELPSSEALEKFRYMKNLKDAKAEDNIRYDVFAALIMEAGKVKGSIWYDLYRTPHYAFRYLKMEGLVEDEKSPSSSVEPRDAIAIISKLSEVQ